VGARVGCEGVVDAVAAHSKTAAVTMMVSWGRWSLLTMMQ
jgi:hypothetical protein